MLAAPTGKSLLAVAGPVQFSAGGVSAPGGRIGIVKTASAGTVSFDPSTLAPAAVTAPALGPVTLKSGAAIATAGPAGGPVSVQCASLVLTGGSLNRRRQHGNWPKVTLSGSDASGNNSVILADSSANGPSGNAGSVTLTAGSLQMLGGAAISAQTSGLSSGGSVTGKAVLSGADPSGFDSGILANCNASGPSGNAGSATLTAGSLEPDPGSQSKGLEKLSWPGLEPGTL